MRGGGGSREAEGGGKIREGGLTIRGKWAGNRRNSSVGRRRENKGRGAYNPREMDSILFARWRPLRGMRGSACNLLEEEVGGEVVGPDAVERGGRGCMDHHARDTGVELVGAGG
jgi:hypothetical protein